MMFPYEQHYADAHDDLAAKVFVSVGAFEDHDGRQREASPLPQAERELAGLRYIDMVADTQRMVDLLRSRNYASLELDSVVMPDEFHITVPSVNLSRSLRCLFDTPR